MKEEEEEEGKLNEEKQEILVSSIVGEKKTNRYTHVS